ncbi:D-amino-acid dehydrogenase [Pseudoxanthobacter soli DSM 19599]|uniref:D-amino acid dehydrogenase n=1 Tax=Pseudoxanthobacter soli DSM 19599 TaxID=1123029 RepID=A0A1M7ZRJ0_9HYPH|nr:D-amino acid dehydrogenase [Pseudoxanthobacter soli]SHO67523.1 D-amino-acid dehydrogenase [Pseudoxanthobacter soli DSM 19599]
MKVVVLGAGVVGVTSAYYLARAGHEVEVVDRQPGVAMETSFGNAGEVSPGYASPWAAPGIPQKALKWLFHKHGPLVIRPQLDPHMYAWLFRMLMNCTHTAYAVNKGRMVALAEYSRDCLKALRQATNIHYDERELGTLQLFRTQQELDHAAEDIAVLRQYGVPYELLDRAGCIAAEPALARARADFVGGLRLPNDETGDCQMFTERLAPMAEALGVKFHFNTTIRRIRADGGRITGIETDGGTITGDTYLVALASFAPQLLRPLGIDAPIYPVKGYSLTLPIVDPEGAPVSTVLDDLYKVAITRLGDRIRIGGMAELSGYKRVLLKERRETLELSINDLFPTGGRMTDEFFWTGLRPMTPDSTPIVGPTRYPNLYVNAGHGTLGWTMSCGSAQVIADLISGRKPEIAADDLAISRYGR